MENLHLDTNTEKNSPVIDFNINGKFLIKGKSTLENTADFYNPILEWVEEYAENEPAKKISIDIKLEYFNTTSSKFILHIFKIFEKLHKNKISEVVINWYYDEDDEDIEEAGHDYASIVKIPFKMFMIC